jgi:hypothetical protein
MRQLARELARGPACSIDQPARERRDAERDHDREGDADPSMPDGAACLLDADALELQVRIEQREIERVEREYRMRDCERLERQQRTGDLRAGWETSFGEDRPLADEKATRA